MIQHITTTEQTKVRVAQDATRSPLVDKKTKAAMQKVLDGWTAKATAAGHESLRAWVEASQAAGIRPAAMLAPKWD